MTTTKTITIIDAATQLGLSESELRPLLKGIYKNPSIIKKISLDNYKLIAETLQERATEDTQTEDTPIENAQTEDTPIEDAQTEDTPIEDAQTEYTPIEDAQTEDTPIEDAQTEDTPIDDAQTKDTPIEEPTSLATTDSQALDIPQDRAKIQLNINLNLSNQILDLNKISSALAIVAGEEAVKNFEQIYNHTFNSGVDRILESFAHRTYTTIQQLREVDNSDFLTQKGRDTSKVDTQTAISLVSQFL